MKWINDWVLHCEVCFVKSSAHLLVEFWDLFEGETLFCLLERFYLQANWVNFPDHRDCFHWNFDRLLFLGEATSFFVSKSKQRSVMIWMIWMAYPLSVVSKVPMIKKNSSLASITTSSKLKHRHSDFFFANSSDCLDRFIT